VDAAQESSIADNSRNPESNMSSHEAIVVFTAKSIERILHEGGTSSWRLDRNHARKCQFALCTRNAHADWVEGPEEHQTGFLIARVRDVVPAPNTRSDDRYLIQFNEFARVDIPGAWKGDRNPVRYSTLEELEIDPSRLIWEPMVESGKTQSFSETSLKRPDVPLTLQEAKNGLALAFGLTPDAIEITIRG
jgi:hypothetical protein